ncbi:MAG: RagB/SusD family nutrient uptake outer membrane protein [Balneolaceae bacterium]|nr:MAG: RagB/SusD family nutrient uptake outer membrane protein [Balneolaceae bacterium]
MKTLKIKYLFGVLLLAGFVAGCGDDFFSHPPTGSIVQETFYKTPEDLAMATGSLYNIVWFDFNDKAAQKLGDAGGGVLRHGIPFYWFRADAAEPRLNESWRSLYIVINQANTHIANMEDGAAPTIDPAVLNHRIAEARFMRGVAYLHLARIWGPVPIITRTDKLIDDPFVYRNRVEDVFQFALNDLKFAADHLVLADAAGRVTEWSAKGYLALTYLSMASHLSEGNTLVQEYLDAAVQYAEDVIQNSPHQLMDNYADLFKRENNNNIESMFALQWVHGSGYWGAQNTVQAYYAPLPALTGVGDGWGGGHQVSNWAFDLLGGASTDDARRKPTYMAYGDHYPELRTAFGGYTHESSRPSIKKYIVGRPEDNDGQVGFMSTDINTYMMRFAEVYLIAAEAILGNNASTTDARALQYFNAVRERAGVEPYSEITFMDIIEERVREFTMEGKFYYDLMRIYHRNPQDAINLVDYQQRHMRHDWSGELNDFELVQDGTPISVNEESFIMAYPEAELTMNPNLREPPVPFDFN